MARKLNILYVDNHLLVVDKPAGLLTQASGREEENLEDLAKEWIKQEYMKPGQVFLHPIHRLDRPASGIVLFARTSKALSRLQEAMRLHQLKKHYTTLVQGSPSPAQGSLEDFLVHDDHRARIVSSETPQAKKAILHYTTLKTFNACTLLEVHLVTGRYHQIRAQLAAHGYPILGDTKYDSSLSWPSPGIPLHHTQLQFPHPTTSQIQTVHSPLPFA